MDRETGEIVVFDPAKTADHLIGIEAVKARAARMKDWPTMELAIAEQVDLQRDHVAWWRASVRGDGRPVKTVADRGQYSAEDAERITGISKQQTSKWAAKVLSDEARAKYQAQLEAKARKAAGLEDEHNHRAQGTGENEWYTPDKYIEAARKVLGEIDLDPATSETANKRIKARTTFTRKDDGLRHNWTGRVWMNPPYSQPAIQHFAQKLVHEFAEGRVHAAIALTHNYTDTEWFHILARSADRICFTRGRIGFVSPDGDIAAPTQGQAFFYLGPDSEAFEAEFSGFGFIR